MNLEQTNPTDLTDSQWAIFEKLLPKAKSGSGCSGRPTIDIRQAVNGIFYLNKTGCQWRMMPTDFGNWNSIYQYFRKWQTKDIWNNAMQTLNQMERKRQGKQPHPSAGCVDSQSVKTVTQGNQVGFDGGKLVDGRKRHILVDTMGLILTVLVSAANMGERRGFKELLLDYFSDGVKRLRYIWLDAGYSGNPLKEWVLLLKKTWQIELDVVENKSKGFNVVKQRWVVERTFAWLNNFRRNSKDYEEKTCHSEAMIQISMIALLLRRLG